MQTIGYYYECFNDNTRLEVVEGDNQSYYCPSCGCTTVAPEEDGMERIEE